MANVIQTPNMNLPNPVPSVDPGPDYANNLSTSLNIVDQHNHSSGSGVQINPPGININSDFPFNDNNATLLRTTRYQSQASSLSPSSGIDINCLYVVQGNLYFNDGAGDTPIQITSGGAVNATVGTLTGGTAQAAFVSNVLVVNSVQSSGTPGNIQAGSILIGNNSTSSNFTTLSAFASLSASYTITLPSAVPGTAGAFLTSDTSGNLSYINVDNSTLNISSDEIKVKSGGITSTQIASGTITSGNIESGTITGQSGGNIAASTIDGTNLANDITLPGTYATIGYALNVSVVVGPGLATQALKVMRGFILSNGTIFSGFQFTVNHSGTGTYIITTGSQFTDEPAVTVTAVGSGIAYVSSITGTGFTVQIVQLGGSFSPQDTDFSFLASGRYQ